MASNSIPQRPNYKKRLPKTAVDDPFSKITLFTPKSIDKLLRDQSLINDLPMSRLTLIALDYAFQNPEIFDLDLELPTTEFKANQYNDQAVKIYEFLKKFPQGTGIDTLWLFRREIGIVDKFLFLSGYRELINTNLVEEIYPHDSRFKYAKSYRYIRRMDIKRRVYRRETQNGAE